MVPALSGALSEPARPAAAKPDDAHREPGVAEVPVVHGKFRDTNAGIRTIQPVSRSGCPTRRPSASSDSPSSRRNFWMPTGTRLKSIFT